MRPEAVHARESGPSSFEMHLMREYQSQLNMLERVGLITNGQMTDIHGNTHYAPQASEIQKRIRGREQYLQHKYNEGLTRLLVVPIKAPLEHFIRRYSAALAAHRKNGTLIDSDGKQITGAPAENKQIKVWTGFNGADKNSTLTYFPTKFLEMSKLEGAVSKRQIPAFMIVLAENNPNVSMRGNGRSFGFDRHDERREFETDGTPDDYMYAMAHNKQHAHEFGFTPEIAIVDAIRRLEETNSVTDDKTENMLLGSFLVSGRMIPTLRWSADDKRAVLGAIEMNIHEPRLGARVAVSI
jgi:hypothetical protein